MTGSRIFAFFILYISVVFIATRNSSKSDDDAFVINSHVISASVRPPEALIKTEGVSDGFRITLM